MIDPATEGYFEFGDCWVLWECEENYPTPYLKSINEHRHRILPKNYDSAKWPGEFGGFEQGCRAKGRADQEFIKHVEHAKYLHDKLPGGKPEPIIIGHHWLKGTEVWGTGLSAPGPVEKDFPEYFTVEDMEELNLEPNTEGIERVQRWKDALRPK